MPLVLHFPLFCAADMIGHKHTLTKKKMKMKRGAVKRSPDKSRNWRSAAGDTVQRQKNVTDTLGREAREEEGNKHSNRRWEKTIMTLYIYIYFFWGGRANTRGNQNKSEGEGWKRKNKTKMPIQKKKKAVNKSRGVKKKKRITRIFDNKDGVEQPYLSCYAPREGSEDEQ